MSRKDAAVLASRALALLFTVWALSEVSYLPVRVYEFLHHTNRESILSTASEYWYHYCIIYIGFLIVRVAGFSLLARWLFKGGPEVEKVFFPSAGEPSAAQD
jgi:hypothetical protein